MAFNALILFHLLHKLTRTVTPQVTIVIAKATLMPHTYALRTPSSSAPENFWCSSVAPIVVTRVVLTFGAVWASLRASWFTKPDCAAASKKVLPIDRYPVDRTNLG